MKAELLKIAGVKSEAEFYKKFPSEETFMKKHGKAVKQLMAKKAQVGTTIQNIQTPTSNPKPVRIDEAFLYDTVAGQMGKESYAEMMKKMQAQAAATAGQQSNNSGGGGIGNFMSMIGPAMQMLGGEGGEGLEGLSAGKYGGKVSKYQGGGDITPVEPTWGQGIDYDTGGEAYSSPLNQSLGIQANQNTTQNIGKVLNTISPIVNDVISFSDQIKSQKQQLAKAKQNRMLSELVLQAAKTEPEKIERDYVRPEDIQNTGEEFFPIYGVGTNAIAKNGGMFSDPGYVPLVNPNQQKSFKQGGVLGSNSYLVPRAAGGFDMSNVSYGGGGAGSIGMQLGDAVGFNNDAGSNIGGKVGGTIGSAFGPVGSAVGSFIGSGIGDLLDRNDRRQRIENEKAEKAQKELSYTAVAPAIQAGYASHVREGGNISPNPTLLDTMKMGGELKTLWGGKADTVSYNPYAGGESIEFKGNSHDYRDPKTGETGIGVAYGEQSVATNTPVVEVENEPAQKLRDGGGSENLVVYGDLKIPEEYVAEIGDDRAKGKKFKNYVSDVLNKDEAKINKKMEKAADSGLESDNTVFGQLERSTADVILKGSDMKLKNIAEKKNILADLQSALNETFDELAIKGNEFITKNKIVEDPERVMNNMAKSGIEINPENKGKFTAWAKERGMSVAEAANKVMANTDEYSPGVVKMANFAKNARKFNKAEYGTDIPKAQGEGQQNTPPNGDFNKQIPKKFKTEQEAIDAGYVKQDDGRWVKSEEGDTKVAIVGDVKLVKETQSLDPTTDLYGGISMSDVEKMKKQNTWYDWDNKFDLTKEKVVGPDGDLVHPDVLNFQEESCEKLKAAGRDCARIDGKLGRETTSINIQETKETPKTEKVAQVAESTTEKTTTAVPQQRGLPFMGFPPRPVEGEELDPNQLLGEYAALSSNVLEPVYAQSYQPKLRVPYDISLQAAKNDVIAQSRALQRNPALQGNPAALALAQAPTYAALNKLNETEFIANQKMKDDVYSQNLDQLNKARLMNLGIYDKQQERQAEAVANTKATTLAALNSISSKYAQKKLENRLEQVYANMYPTYRYNKNFQTEVQQPAMFNVNGKMISGIPGLATPGFNPALQQITGGLGVMQSIIGAQQQFNEEQGPQIRRGALNRAMQNFDPNDIYDYVDPNQNNMYTPIEEGVAKKGKTVKKNNKNSNILKALRGL
jgi:hypothetical protein